jgi:type I restriction enzyme S subunit
MKFGLANNVIEEIQQVLETNPKIDKGIIFGSRAKGTYKDGSDIDIAIKGVNLKLDDILTLKVKLDDWNLSYDIDLINYADIKEPALTDHIDRVGIVFYSSWKEWAFSHFVEINPLVKLSGAKEYPFVEMKDLQDGIKTCMPSTKRVPSGGARFRERDTLFARITPCLENGKICQVKGLEGGLGFGSTEFLVFRGKPGISDADFIYYLARWEEVREFAERNFVGTSGRQRVPKDCFDDLRLLLPPLEEQKAIANVLSYLDDKINLLHRQNKTLESMAETLFRQWFVKEAKEDWEEKTLDECIWFDPREKINRNIFRQFFEMKCLSNTDMNIAQSELRVVTSGSVFRNGDTLLAKITPCLENGKTGFVMQLEENEVAMGSTEFIVMRSKGSVSPYWIYCLARSEDFRDNAILSMTGTSGRQRVQLGLLKSIKVKINNGAMKSFHQMISPMFAKIKSNQNQIHSLVALRDTLLPKLLSGEARVKLS